VFNNYYFRATYNISTKIVCRRRVIRITVFARTRLDTISTTRAPVATIKVRFNTRFTSHTRCVCGWWRRRLGWTQFLRTACKVAVFARACVAMKIFSF